MKYIIIANIIATIASLIMIYSGFIENKKKFLIAQNTHVCIQMISNLLLNGISGVVNNILTSNPETIFTDRLKNYRS